jgi:predicted ester cyclase
MRRSTLLLLTCLLAAITGVALLGAGALVAVPAGETGSLAAPSGNGSADPDLVGNFYEAVNATVATGDPASLVDLLAADFADRAAHPGYAPTHAGLVEHLLALRATFPTMWLTVEDLQAQGDWVLARLRVDGAGRGVFFGVSLSVAPTSWDAIELVRTAGGRIAERRAAGDWPVLPHLLTQAPLARTPAGAFVRLGRLTFAPGASQPRTAIIGPLLVAVERGTLTAVVEGEAVLVHGEDASTNASPTGEVIVGAGDALLLSSSARYSARNTGTAPAVVLTLALFPWNSGATDAAPFFWPEARLPDVTAQLLAEGAMTDLPDGPATIAIGRVSLAVGAELGAVGANEPRLAVVEAGALQVETTAGLGATLSVGQGTLVQPASMPTFRNAGDGPLVVLLVAITPTATSA